MKEIKGNFIMFVLVVVSVFTLSIFFFTVAIGIYEFVFERFNHQADLFDIIIGVLTIIPSISLSIIVHWRFLKLLK